MINIDNIINAPLILDPWPHKIIDNVLDQAVFDQLSKAAKIITDATEQYPRDGDGIWLSTAQSYGVDVDTINNVIKISNEWLKHNSKVLNDFSDAKRSPVGYFSLSAFNFCKENDKSGIHDEGPCKTTTLVIYLHPEESIGTRLYTDLDENSFVKEIEWKPNRALLFCAKEDVTWHSFWSDNNKRLTLNLYYERLETFESFKKYSLEQQQWFYEQYGQGNLAVLND